MDTAQPVRGLASGSRTTAAEATSSVAYVPFLRERGEVRLSIPEQAERPVNTLTLVATCADEATVRDSMVLVQRSVVIEPTCEA